MRKFGNKSGFSLVELMIAMAILSIALLSLISVIVVNMKLDRLTKEYNIAQNAANLELERIMSLDYNTEVLDPQPVGMNLAAADLFEDDFDVFGLKVLNAEDPPGTGGTDIWHSDVASNRQGYIRVARVSRSKSGYYDNLNDTNFVDTSTQGNNLLRILVRVDWRGADGHPKSFVLRSVRSDRGANVVQN